MSMIAVALAFHMFHAGPSSHLRVVTHRGDVHGWHWTTIYDRFAGKVSCKLAGHDMRVQSMSVIFKLDHDFDTTHAIYRIDLGLPHPVSDAFQEDQKNNIFPERGWIVDRNGGEAVLPLSYLTNAREVWIRSTPKSKQHHFDVSRLPQVLAVLKSKYCPVEML